MCFTKYNTVLTKYNTFNFPETSKVDDVLKQFENYCCPQKCIIYKIFKFLMLNKS